MRARCRSGSVKDDFWFPGSHNWTVVVPSTETAKTRKGRTGWGAGAVHVLLDLRYL